MRSFYLSVYLSVSFHLSLHTSLISESYAIILLSVYPLILISRLMTLPWNRDSAVGIATAYGRDDRGVGVRVPVGSRIFSSCRPYRLWGPPNLLYNEYLRLFPQE
jgi:hypothetical protein